MKKQTPKLSAGAVKIYNRMCKGAFYFAYDPKTPKAMQELIDAGLVTRAGRATQLRSCYVPRKGFKPLRLEDFSKCEPLPETQTPPR